MTDRVERIGPYLAVTDGDGLRHLIRIGSIQMLSDGDLCRDTAIIVVAGRAIVVAEPLDTLAPLLGTSYR